MKTLGEQRDYLACEQDGSETATKVCGDCGAPICSKHSATVVDTTLTEYVNGVNTLLLGVVMIGVATFLIPVIPRWFWLFLTNLNGSPLYIRGGLKLGLTIIGLTLIGVLHVRWVNTGFSILNFEILKSEKVSRTVCEDCYKIKRGQKYASWAISIIAIGLIGYAIYRVLPGMYFEPIWIAGVGIALWLVRYRIVGALFQYLEQPKNEDVVTVDSQ